MYIQSILGTKLELLLFADTELKMFDPMRFGDNFCFLQPILLKIKCRLKLSQKF